MNKSWASTCLPVHKEFKYSVLRLVCKLRTFVCVALTEEFMTIFFNKFAFFLDFINTLWNKTIPWWMHKFMMSKESTLYASAPTCEAETLPVQSVPANNKETIK